MEHADGRNGGGSLGVRVPQHSLLLILNKINGKLSARN